MPDPPFFYAVCEIATQQIIYCGRSLDKAVELLTEGCCYAVGINGIKAERNCRAMAAAFGKRVVQATRKLDKS